MAAGFKPVMLPVGRDHHGALGQPLANDLRGHTLGLAAACSMAGVICPANAASRCVMGVLYLKLWGKGSV